MQPPISTVDSPSLIYLHPSDLLPHHLSEAQITLWIPSCSYPDRIDAFDFKRHSNSFPQVQARDKELHIAMDRHNEQGQEAYEFGWSWPPPWQDVSSLELPYYSSRAEATEELQSTASLPVPYPIQTSNPPHLRAICGSSNFHEVRRPSSSLYSSTTSTIPREAEPTTPATPLTPSSPSLSWPPCQPGIIYRANPAALTQSHVAHEQSHRLNHLGPGDESFYDTEQSHPALQTGDFGIVSHDYVIDSQGYEYENPYFIGAQAIPSASTINHHHQASSQLPALQVYSFNPTEQTAPYHSSTENARNAGYPVFADGRNLPHAIQSSGAGLDTSNAPSDFEYHNPPVQSAATTQANPKIQKEIEDAFLWNERHVKGVSYKALEVEWQRRFGKVRKESSLRGRMRALVRKKEHRLRNPPWTRNDNRLLRGAVEALIRKHGPEWQKEIKWDGLAKNLWKEDGSLFSYPFSGKGCHKQWRSLIDSRQHPTVSQPPAQDPSPSTAVPRVLTSARGFTTAQSPMVMLAPERSYEEIRSSIDTSWP